MGTDTGLVLVLGGRSEIGLAVSERLARRGNDTVVLAARRASDLDAEESGLRAAGARTVARLEFDADRLDGHDALLADVFSRFGPPAITIVAFGVLGDQAEAEADPTAAATLLHTDFVAQAHLLTALARRLRAVGNGEIVVFSSIAGVRVRRANYVYGSAKAGLDGFAGGLADALVGSGVHLLLVRPGFVIGRMTRGMTPAPFSSTPDQVADAVVAALTRGRDVVWVPGILRWVAAGMRMTPRRIWRRLPR